MSNTSKEGNISSKFDTSDAGHEHSTPFRRGVHDIHFSNAEVEQFSDILGEEVTLTPAGELVSQNGKPLKELPLVRKTMLDFARSHIAILDSQIEAIEVKRTKDRFPINEEVPKNLSDEKLYERPGSPDPADYTPKKLEVKAAEDEYAHYQWIDKSKINTPVRHPKDLLKPELKKSLEEISAIAAHPAVVNRMREYYSGESYDDPVLQDLRAQRAAWLEVKADLLS